MAESVYYNARFEQQAITGVQRYARDLVDGLSVECPIPIRPLAPPTAYPTWRKHLWEQHELPKKLRQLGNPLLINYCNTAPHRVQRQIVTIHDAAVFDMPNMHRKWFRVYYRWLFRQMSHHALHIVTVSNFSADRIQHWLDVPHDKITVIPPMITTAIQRAEATPVPSLVSRKFVLTVGSFHPGKNIPWSLDALAAWRKKNGMIHCVVGTAAGPFNKIPLAVGDDVRCLDRVSDGELKWLYQHASAVIQPSTYEGFGLVPSEAAQFTQRIVVSDIPAHRESAGSFAVFFALGDKESLQTAVEGAMKRSAIPALAPQLGGQNQWQQLIQRFQ